MAQSTLFFGGNKKNREEEIFKVIDNIKSPDVLIIDKQRDKRSIGIDQIREGIKFLQEKPFESLKKYLLIPEAGRLTTEAQNSMLKILEEPPSYAEIRLGSRTENELLETVVSRCKKIDMHRKEQETRVGEFEKENVLYEYLVVKKMTTGERLDLVENLAKEDKDDILEILDGWVVKERELLVTGKENYTKTIEMILKVREDLENTNVNTKLALEYLAINI